MEQLIQEVMSRTKSAWVDVMRGSMYNHVISNRLLIKKRNRISNTRDSYRISIFTSNLYNSSSITLIIIVYLVTKLYIYLTISSGILRFYRLYTSLSYKT